jgi:hypothetical protein
MAKKSKLRKWATSPLNTVKAIPRNVRKSASLKNAKGYSKIAMALGTAGLGYALVQETAKGITRTLVPTHSGNIEWRWTNTELGLAGQTLLFVSAANIASSQLKDLGFLTNAEKKVAANAGAGLAVGRAMMGTGILDIGKRFEYLLDGEIGAAIWPGAGPAVTMPANAAAAAQIVTKHENPASGYDNYQVDDAYLRNRVSRGMPYSTTEGKQAVVSNGMISFQPPMYL